MSSIEFTDFAKVEMRVGTVVAAEINAKARVPAVVLDIDFGELGVKKSSAQITEHYTTENVIGRQVIAVANLPPRRVAGIKSEVLVLASTGVDGTVLLAPDRKVENGSRVA